MNIDIRIEPASTLADYARVPIAFEVTHVLDIAIGGTGASGFILSERRLDQPYVKDYDTAPGGGPAHWPQRFDLSRWAIFAAYIEGQRVGGAAVAFDDATIQMCDGRDDLAVLWDIRVCFEVRRHRVGSALFHAAEVWASERGCQRLKIETQNINVPACRFYERHGCALGPVDPFAYPSLPDEIQLLWYKNLEHNRR